MNRFLKWALILAGTLVLITIVATVALPMLFDGENLKRKISAAVTEETGREFRIDGDLSFSVFPVLALELNQLTLGNAEGFGEEPFAEIRQARAGIGLLPLLKQDIQTEEFVLDGLRVNLFVKPDGTSNWEDLASDGTSAGPPPEVTQHVPYGKPNIAGVKVTDANIVYRDDQTGLHYKLSGFNLKTGALGESGPVPITLAMALEDIKAKSRLDLELAADAELDASTRTLSLPNLNMRLDDSRIEGSLSLALLDAALPAIRFELDMDQIDLDRYLAPTEPSESSEPTQEVEIPRDELAGLDVEGTLRIAKLTAMGMELSNAELGLKVKDRVLRLHPLKAGFYGGQYNGDITLNAAGALPTLSLNEQIESITFTELARDLLGYDQVSGSAHGSLQATGSGKTSDALINDLKGKLELRLDEGALEGIDVWHEIRQAMALLKGQPAPKDGQGRTVFSRMNMNGSLGGGNLKLDQILAELPFLTVKGNGMVNLNSTVMDIGLTASVLKSPELAGDPLAVDLEGRSVPFRISGPADNPSIKVDVEDLLKGEATRRLMDKLGLGQDTGDTTEPAEDSTEQAVKGLLGGLLGGKKKKDEDDDDGGG